MSEQDVQAKLFGKDGQEVQGLTAVRAYFACNTVQTTVHGAGKPQHKVTFGAIYGNKEGSLSKDYADATPAGEMWMNITDGYPALAFFKPGKKYFLTFTEAPD